MHSCPWSPLSIAIVWIQWWNIPTMIYIMYLITHHIWSIDICLCCYQTFYYLKIAILAGHPQWRCVVLEIKNISVIAHCNAHPHVTIHIISTLWWWKMLQRGSTEWRVYVSRHAWARGSGGMPTWKKPGITFTAISRTSMPKLITQFNSLHATGTFVPTTLQHYATGTFMCHLMYAISVA